MYDQILYPTTLDYFKSFQDAMHPDNIIGAQHFNKLAKALEAIQSRGRYTLQSSAVSGSLLEFSSLQYTVLGPRNGANFVPITIDFTNNKPFGLALNSSSLGILVSAVAYRPGSSGSPDPTYKNCSAVPVVAASSPNTLNVIVTLDGETWRTNDVVQLSIVLGRSA